MDKVFWVLSSRHYTEEEFLRSEHRYRNRIEYNQDNDLLISYNVKNPFNMIPWILQYGSDIEVLEPEYLRHKITKDLYEVMRVYKEW